MKIPDFDPEQTRIFTGDCRAILSTMPERSVQCCVTSPPYYGLRDYGTATWDGGNPECNHLESSPERTAKSQASSTLGGGKESVHMSHAYKDVCGKCGARRIDNQIGMEPTPDSYVAQMVEVFRGVKRVLRDDGIMWLNLGSSFSSKVIKSSTFVIRRDLPENVRAQVAQAMSRVWAGYESAEQVLQSLSHQSQGTAGELSAPQLWEMRESVSNPPIPSSEGRGPVLFQGMRPIGKPDAQKSHTINPMSGMRETCEALACEHEEKQNRKSVLLGDVLVSAQSTRPTLPLGRRPERTAVPGWQDMAEGSAVEGQGTLSPLSFAGAVGSAPHQTVAEPSGTEIRRDQWDHVVPPLPQDNRQERNGDCGGTIRYPRGRVDDLARIAFPREAIPPGFDGWCEPQEIIKPTSDLGIPWRVAFALQADGWILRSPIVWHKPNPMPESCKGRPTSAYEMVFMFAKSARYFYDADAIAEPAADSTRARAAKGYAHGGTNAPDRGDAGQITRPFSDKPRNARNVWTITEPKARLRADIPAEKRAYVLAELAHRGLV
jgi:DNA modification methylase